MSQGVVPIKYEVEKGKVVLTEKLSFSRSLLYGVCVNFEWQLFR